MLLLYSYFRSSAAFRVRIALNLKNVEYETAPIDLLKGEQRSPAYLAMNPQGLVPALRLADGRVLTQSTAILEWIDAAWPRPALLPSDEFERARVRACCSTIACDIHPLNNLRVLEYLSGTLTIDEQQKTAWYHHWLEAGFNGLEQQLAASPCSHGREPGMTDVYLVPQIANALRYRFDMTCFPKLSAVYAHCMTLDAFVKAHPDAQPDHPKNAARSGARAGN
jgi:maleylacetoacetate isomerase